jgi:hypothetical protein
MSIERGPKKPEFIEVGGKKIRVGDKVKVLTRNGVVEGGWTLKSFGNKKAVVVLEGTSLRMVVDLGVFKRWQTLPESPKHYARQYTPSRPEEPKETDIERFKREVEGKIGVKGYPCRELSVEEKKKMAKQWGIDTSRPDWEEKFNEMIRRRVGA